MQLKVGDQVKVLNEALEGVVSKIVNENEVYVLTEQGFDFLYTVNELIKVSEKEDAVEFQLEDTTQFINKILSRPDRPVKDAESNTHSYLKPFLERGMLKNKRGDSLIEIDLHLHKIVSAPGSLNNWEKIHIQVDYCRNCLEEAMNLKITGLVFIHGIGEGRLKQEIRNLLKTYPNVDYFDADYSRYGYGATQVKIKGLFT